MTLAARPTCPSASRTTLAVPLIQSTAVRLTRIDAPAQAPPAAVEEYLVPSRRNAAAQSVASQQITPSAAPEP